MRRSAGFTLIELVVVLFVIAMLAGTVAPLATATDLSERMRRVEDELEEISDALTRYYYEEASFPSALDASDFFGVYLETGVDGGKIRDEWGTANYRVQTSSNPDVWTIWSVGQNGVNDGSSSETYVAVVAGSVAGNRRTRDRLRVIAGALADHIGSGGNLSGNWATDRNAMGLGTEYQLDGFGTAFAINASTRVVRSAGADRQFFNDDDLSL